jgi:hypothetical protein
LSPNDRYAAASGQSVLWLEVGRLLLAPAMMLPPRVTMLPLAFWHTDDTSPQMTEQGRNRQQWSNHRTGRLLIRKQTQKSRDRRYTVAIVSAAMTTETDGESPSALPWAATNEFGTRRGACPMRQLPTMARILVFAFAAMATAFGTAAVAAESQVGVAGALDKKSAEKAFPAQTLYSPYAGRNFPTRPYFGDTHLHTSFSMDAGAFGARLTPRDAYVFAKGNEVKSSSGQPVKLSRPLDFLVVADHSDGMGFFPLLMSGSPEILADPQGKKWYEMLRAGQGAAAAIDIIQSFGKGAISKAILPVPGTRAYQGAWAETIKAAEEANDPGRFTAFIGYEWTSNTGGNNLHRNVIFRDGATKASVVEPYTTMQPLGSDNPVDLWKWMAGYEEKAGGNVLAIAHNGNLSNGRMFPTVEALGKPVDRAYAENRAKWERLYETTQTKGDGEAHPYLSPNDEFANFEKWDKGNLDGSAAKTKEMLEFEYARSGLKNGLMLEQKLGVNPYKFGLVGSTHRPRRDGGRQFLRQDRAAGTESGAHDRHVLRQQADRREDHGLGSVRVGLRGRLGDGQHARGPVRRDGAARDLRDDRYARDRALLRRLGLRARGRRQPAAGCNRLRQGRAHGRRPERRARRQVADVPGGRSEGPDWCESRPHPDRQGLARREGRAAGKGVRRRLG